MIRIQEFDYSIDLLKFIFWQYDTPSNENIAALVKQKSEAAKAIHSDFWDDWYTNVFNLETCNEFGISVWAYILDLPIVVDSPQSTKIGFGFGAFRKNFDNGNFNLGAGGAALLTLEQKRQTLLLRYRKLTSTGSVTDANKILNDVLGDLGLIYMQDNLDMTVTYVFDIVIPPWIDFIATEYDIFPTPAGVSYTLQGL